MLTKLLKRRSCRVVRKNSVPIKKDYDDRRNGKRNRENSKTSYKPCIIGSNGSVSVAPKHCQNSRCLTGILDKVPPHTRCHLRQKFLRRSVTVYNWGCGRRIQIAVAY